MSESEAAPANTDLNRNSTDNSKRSNDNGAVEVFGSSKSSSVGAVQNDEQTREKWKRGKLKKEEIKKETFDVNDCPEKVPGVQNGISNTGQTKVVKCPLCGIKVASDAELGLHLKSKHVNPVLQSQKPTKGQSPSKVIKHRVQYVCLTCKGKTFASKLSFHRHLLLHVTLPVLQITRLAKDVEETSDDAGSTPPSRPQVALKRVTVSCNARSPLKFRLKVTNDRDGKDSFKLVKSSVKNCSNLDNSESNQVEIENIPEQVERTSVIIKGGNASENLFVQEVNGIEGPCTEKEQSGEVDSAADEKKDENETFSNSEVESTVVEASNAVCSVPFEGKVSVPNSPKNISKSSEILPSSSVVELIKDGIMRQMKNVESEMENIQSRSPSVVDSSQEPRQLSNDKVSLSASVGIDCESLDLEFIPIEQLDKDGPLQHMNINAPGDSLSNSKSLDKMPELCMPGIHMLCEACGETVIGDQTALEDHCFCRGHYKCPICSVACASTDALAIHSKESHPNVDIVKQLSDRKKKSSNRSHRQKHSDITEKDSGRESHSDLSNSSIPSPSIDIHTPPLTSPTGVISESIQSPLQNKRVSEIVQGGSRTQEQNTRQNSPSGTGSIASSEAATPPSSNLGRGSSLHPSPQSRLPQGRVSESMPPPLMRPPHIRNLESQPRMSMPNVPMQPPPALYKIPPSHGMSNTRGAPTASAIPNAGYPRGIPASGYQPDPQAAPVSNHYVTSASNHLAASAAALNARYQSMHHGYPPGSQPQPGYPPYQQSLHIQQRYAMPPPPPYPNQLPPHLQQGPRGSIMPQNAYSLASSQQVYNQSLLKAQLEQARMQLPQPSTMLQSMQNLQQEHYQQQQLQQQLFQHSASHQILQPPQQEQVRAPAPPQPQNPQKRKSSGSSSSQLRYHHQTALQNQQQLQSQLQQATQPPAKQRRQQRDNIGIPSKQTDSDCEIIAVQQRGEGVPVIQSIQGSNAPSAGENSNPGGDSSGSGSTPSSESTIHLTDSITLSVRQPPGSNSAGSPGQRGHNANAVASILATRGITVTPASGASVPRSSSGQHRTRRSPPLNQAQAPSPPQQPSTMGINSAISISQPSRQSQNSNDGFAVPAPVAPQRSTQRQSSSPADRPPRPPTVDLTDENALAQAANSISTCRLCDKPFPSPETLQQHMLVIHHTRHYFRCSICNTKHPSQQALGNHIKKVHKFGGISNSAPEFVIPLVDLKNTGAMNRLSSLGVNYVISLSQLGMNQDSGSFCIPIMSLDSSGQARNNSISGLMSLGTAAVLPIGPVKSLPTAQQNYQPPPPQTVTSTSNVNAALPPLAPLRHTSQQYVQSSNQAAPR